MSNHALHDQVERQMSELLADAGLPQPDDIARLERVVIFLWYETKAFVMVDLDEMPAGERPLDGLDVELLRADVLGLPFPLPGAPGEGFADAA